MTAPNVGINIGGRPVILSDWKDDSLYGTIDARSYVDHPFVYPGWFDARWQVVAASDVLRLEARRVLAHNGHARHDVICILDEIRRWASGESDKNLIDKTAKRAQATIRGPRWMSPEVSFAASTLDPPYVGNAGAWVGMRARDLAKWLAADRRRWLQDANAWQLRLYEAATTATGMLNRDPEVVSICERARILDLSQGRPVVDEDVRAAALAVCQIGERAAARRIVEEYLKGVGG